MPPTRRRLGAIFDLRLPHSNMTNSRPFRLGTLVEILLLVESQAGGRICQTSVHLSFPQTNPVAAIRFAFFFVQAACMIAMGVIAAAAAGS